MPMLSKRMMTDVDRAYYKAFGLHAYFLDLSGKVINAPDPFAALKDMRTRCTYALQQSVDAGEPYRFDPVAGIVTWVMGLENARRIHGAVLSGPVGVASDSRVDAAGAAGDRSALVGALCGHGMDDSSARSFVDQLPVWSSERTDEAAEFLVRTFYDISGWKPVLTQENRLKVMQQEQINQAIHDQRRNGSQALYAFEKERVLLSNIRAGDRNGARRILNQMLATIYLSSPRLVVLRARAVELMSCLARAAIEDNPLLEPLMEQNHRWTEQLITAGTFEEISGCLMSALDDFIDDVYLHGVNRTNVKVRKALDFLRQRHAERIVLADVAAEVGLSPYRLSHLVKEHTGKTVLGHLRQIRIQRARHLLERTEKSCTDIAYEVGYGDQSYFIKQFKKVTGLTPSRYRRHRP